MEMMHQHPAVLAQNLHIHNLWINDFLKLFFYDGSISKKQVLVCDILLQNLYGQADDNSRVNLRKTV